MSPWYIYNLLIVCNYFEGFKIVGVLEQVRARMVKNYVYGGFRVNLMSLSTLELKYL